MIKKFNQLYENKSNDFLENRLNSKISHLTETINNYKDTIELINKKLSEDYICVYDNFNYPQIKLIPSPFLDFGALLKSFNDPYDDLMESSFYLYKDYILWERRSYTILYMKKDNYKKMKANEFNV